MVECDTCNIRIRGLIYGNDRDQEKGRLSSRIACHAWIWRNSLPFNTHVRRLLHQGLWQITSKALSSIYSFLQESAKASVESDRACECRICRLAIDEWINRRITSRIESTFTVDSILCSRSPEVNRCAIYGKCSVFSRDREKLQVADELMRG